VGIKIATQYSGVCVECETKYSKNDIVYYDKEHTNSKGNAIVCKDFACFSEQGGKVDLKSSSARTTVEDLTFEIPGDIIIVRPEIISDNITVLMCLKTAHKTVSQLYPKLDPLSNTFGMIRNAIKDNLVSMYNARRICNNKTVKESLL